MKTGMIVRLRNGKQYVVVKHLNILVELNEKPKCISIKNYEKDYRHKSQLRLLDIAFVFEPTFIHDYRGLDAFARTLEMAGDNFSLLHKIIMGAFF